MLPGLGRNGVSAHGAHNNHEALRHQKQDLEILKENKGEYLIWSQEEFLRCK